LFLASSTSIYDLTSKQDPKEEQNLKVAEFCVLHLTQVMSLSFDSSTSSSTFIPLSFCKALLNTSRKRSGLAIRSPRFTGNSRFDKSTEVATNAMEIVEMYHNQLKRICESQS